MRGLVITLTDIILIIIFVLTGWSIAFVAHPVKWELDKTKVKLHTLQAKYNNLTKIYKKTLLELSNVKKELKNVKTKLSNLQKEYDSLKELYNSITKQYYDIKSKYDSLLIKYNQLKQENEQLKQENENLKAQLQEAQASSEEWKQKYNELKQQFDKLADNYKWALLHMAAMGYMSSYEYIQYYWLKEEDYCNEVKFNVVKCKSDVKNYAITIVGHRFDPDNYINDFLKISKFVWGNITYKLDPLIWYTLTPVIEYDNDLLNPAFPLNCCYENGTCDCISMMLDILNNYNITNISISYANKFIDCLQYDIDIVGDTVFSPVDVLFLLKAGDCDDKAELEAVLMEGYCGKYCDDVGVINILMTLSGDTEGHVIAYAHVKTDNVYVVCETTYPNGKCATGTTIEEAVRNLYQDLINLGGRVSIISVVSKTKGIIFIK